MFRSDLPFRSLVALAVMCSLSSCGVAADGRNASSSGATGCRQIVGPGPAAATASGPTTEDLRSNRVYECTLHAGDAPVFATLVVDTALHVVSQIEIRRDTAQPPTETLSANETETPYFGANFFQARDLDGDGHLDLMLLSDWGVTGNESYNVWRWNATTRKFAFDSTLSILSQPKPVAGTHCVTGRSNGGHAGKIYSTDSVCFDRGHWVELSADEQQWNDHLSAYIHVVRQRRGDSLVVTRVDTVHDTTDR